MGKLSLIQKLNKLWKYFKFGANLFVYHFSTNFSIRQTQFSKSSLNKLLENLTHFPTKEEDNIQDIAVCL